MMRMCREDGAGLQRNSRKRGHHARPTRKDCKFEPSDNGIAVKLGLIGSQAERAWDLSSELIRGIANISPSSSKPKAYVEIDLGGPVTFGVYS